MSSKELSYNPEYISTSTPLHFPQVVYCGQVVFINIKGRKAKKETPAITTCTRNVAIDEYKLLSDCNWSHNIFAVLMIASVAICKEEACI